MVWGRKWCQGWRQRTTFIGVASNLVLFCSVPRKVDPCLELELELGSIMHVPRRSVIISPIISAVVPALDENRLLVTRLFCWLGSGKKSSEAGWACFRWNTRVCWWFRVCVSAWGCAASFCVSVKQAPSCQSWERIIFLRPLLHRSVRQNGQFIIYSASFRSLRNFFKVCVCVCVSQELNWLNCLHFTYLNGHKM